MKFFRLRILTPKGAAYDAEVRSAVLLTEDGKIGFLPDREECLLEVMSGELRFRDAKGNELCFETESGIARMQGKELTLLCQAAYPKEQANQMKEARLQELSEEKRRRERSLAEYKLTRVNLMRQFDKLKRTSRQK